MSPLPKIFSRSLQTINTADFSAVRAQWKNPNDILTLLMIIGGDIVRGALSQLASSDPRPFTPVAFSFGWVVYSFSAILSIVGSHRLAPEPDYRCSLIDVQSGYARDVNSWVLARLVRDYRPPPDHKRGLSIAFFDTIPEKDTGVPDRDWVYYLGTFVILLQLGIAVIPGIFHGNWLILILTVGGNLLAQIQGAIPQWKQELWAARKIGKDKREVVCLTKGNGSSYAIVIRSDSCGLRLADLAGGREVESRTTVYMTCILAVLWFVHLLTMQSVDNDPWYTLAIGAIGMLQNVIAAGVRRAPGALGFHLKESFPPVHDDKAFQALKSAEEKEEKVGLVLVDIFFPGGLRPSEERWRKERKRMYNIDKSEQEL
ncbi:hypothetical protein D9757_011548 [Collybiopsis confluens]|uniref:Uncharacterized protein n=1 Tax=Collybiopsis confluens TaxID=2823264 RepID=A0A8H5GB34_9AGAR|nr:hypothetical protein D9757_011548 [Collybiopsis confluens]